jgi:shikimate kinase
MTRIALVGYRGTGKSTVARLLAQKLGLELVELDRLIDERAGERIPEIVSRFGWEKFRSLETELLAEVVQKDNVVFDLGGGVVEREENRELIKKHCLVIWLKASPEMIVKRIKDQMHRPSLTGKSFTDEVPEVLKRREPLYRSVAQLELDTESRTPEELAEQIAAYLKSQKTNSGRT